MKYGAIMYQKTRNIGDDILTYAGTRFLPRIDYWIERERMEEFCPDEGEPVAVIMNGWYLHTKWNWPPSKYIIPKLMGFHYDRRPALSQDRGGGVGFEFLTGIGKEYLDAYGPVGCRDYPTMEKFRELGIDAYFSGCLTLTLPHMPETPDKGSYICLVDLDRRVEDKLSRLLKRKGVDVRIITHTRRELYTLPPEERLENVKELLTQYQNARCVVSKRLHCLLPCLAMETPAFLIDKRQNNDRFIPYYDFLHRCTVSEFMKNQYSYDFLNPPANKADYLPYREKLIADVERFVNEMEKVDDQSIEALIKTSYSDVEVQCWRHDLLLQILNEWDDFQRSQTNVTTVRGELRKIYSILKKAPRWLSKQIRIRWNRI